MEYTKEQQEWMNGIKKVMEDEGACQTLATFFRVKKFPHIKRLVVGGIFEHPNKETHIWTHIEFTGDLNNIDFPKQNEFRADNSSYDRLEKEEWIDEFMKDHEWIIREEPERIESFAQLREVAEWEYEKIRIVREKVATYERDHPYKDVFGKEQDLESEQDLGPEL